MKLYLLIDWYTISTILNITHLSLPLYYFIILRYHWRLKYIIDRQRHHPTLSSIILSHLIASSSINHHPSIVSSLLCSRIEYDRREEETIAIDYPFIETSIIIFLHEVSSYSGEYHSSNHSSSHHPINLYSKVIPTTIHPPPPSHCHYIILTTLSLSHPIIVPLFTSLHYYTYVSRPSRKHPYYYGYYSSSSNHVIIA